MNKQEIIHKIKSIEGLLQTERAYLIELVNTKKRYGLVWEDKPEDVEELLCQNLPILKEVIEKRIIGSSLQKNPTATKLELFDNDNNSKVPKFAPNHVLIEGDNLHALATLSFTHNGKFDVIYIDPPYNTGNKDFIYNDKYIDKEDGFRHSKWLSFMHKRLKIANALLSQNGIIAISIGYQEVHNLVVLCEELFQNKQVVCVTVQTSGGKPSGGFNYLQEYVLFITSLNFNPKPFLFSGGVSRSPYEGLTLSTFDKTQRPNQSYPIFIDKKTGCIVGTGKSLASRVKEGLYLNDLASFEFDFNEAPEGTVALWPITSKGSQCVWRLIPSRLMTDWGNGYIKVSPNVSSKNPNKFSVQYLPEGVINKIKSGELTVVGTEKDRPTLVFGENKTVGSDIPTIWTEKDFFTTKGSVLLREMFKESKFTYPKPLDLICEILRATSESNSAILDFFAGSGTALHATMQLNSEDGGNRQCVLVTNNENNICEEVTYVRNKKVIEGFEKVDGEKVEGLMVNNLRYYKTEFVPSVKSEENKRLLTQSSTDLLCIKEDCYNDITEANGFNKKQCSILSNDTGKYLIIVYHSRQQLQVCDQLVDYIKTLKDISEKIRLYAFSPEKETLSEDFIEVADKIEAVPLPEAIYNAYRATFRAIKLDKKQTFSKAILASEQESESPLVNPNQIEA